MARDIVSCARGSWVTPEELQKKKPFSAIQHLRRSNDSLIFSSRRLHEPIHYSIINKSYNCARSESCVCFFFFFLSFFFCSNSHTIVCERCRTEMSNVRIESTGSCLSLKAHMVAGNIVLMKALIDVELASAGATRKHRRREVIRINTHTLITREIVPHRAPFWRIRCVAKTYLSGEKHGRERAKAASGESSSSHFEVPKTTEISAVTRWIIHRSPTMSSCS